MSRQTPVGSGNDPEIQAAADPVIHDAEEKSPGVLRMEAVASVFTKFDKMLLFGGLFLGACKSAP